MGESCPIPSEQIGNLTAKLADPHLAFETRARLIKDAMGSVPEAKVQACLVAILGQEQENQRNHAFRPQLKPGWNNAHGWQEAARGITAESILPAFQVIIGIKGPELVSTRPRLLTDPGGLGPVREVLYPYKDRSIR
jgi:hypothetical protein